MEMKTLTRDAIVAMAQNEVEWTSRFGSKSLMEVLTEWYHCDDKAIITDQIAEGTSYNGKVWVKSSTSRKEAVVEKPSDVRTISAGVHRLHKVDGTVKTIRVAKTGRVFNAKDVKISKDVKLVKKVKSNVRKTKSGALESKKTKRKVYINGECWVYTYVGSELVSRMKKT